jgi:polyhydroxybutyrate depolymerase
MNFSISSLSVWLSILIINFHSNCYASVSKELHIQSADTKRGAATLYLPDNYRSKEKWPLVMLLHGSSATGMLQNIFFRLSSHVDSRGFMLLIPEGTKDKDGSQFWNATEACCDTYHTGVDDEKYLLDLIAQVKAKYAVDGQRVYIMGHSNGGFMAYRMACHASSTFAAIASLAGATYVNESECHATEPVAVLEIHAKDDSQVLYDGSTAPDGAGYPSAPETIQRWRATNGCPNASTQAGPFNWIWEIPGKDTSVETWSDCMGGAEVSFWNIRPFALHFSHAPIVKRKFVTHVLDFLFAHHK